MSNENKVTNIVNFIEKEDNKMIHVDLDDNSLRLMGKKHEDISILVLILLCILFFPLALLYVAIQCFDGYYSVETQNAFKTTHYKLTKHEYNRLSDRLRYLD